MTLGEAQEAFAELEARWVLWVLAHPGWKLRHGEGRILPMGPDNKGRQALDLVTAKPTRVEDRVHMRGGTHYLGCGADWQLFVNDEWINDGAHPSWQACGEKWESMGPLCRWGGRFKDANHISMEFGGKQ